MTPADIFTQALESISPTDLSRPQIQRFGPRDEERQSANDEADFDPQFIRTPELDHRIARGDMTDANAWRERSTGRTVFYVKSYDANARRWLALDDVQGRAAVDGERA